MSRSKSGVMVIAESQTDSGRHVSACYRVDSGSMCNSKIKIGTVEEYMANVAERKGELDVGELAVGETGVFEKAKEKTEEETAEFEKAVMSHIDKLFEGESGKPPIESITKNEPRSGQQRTASTDTKPKVMSHAEMFSAVSQAARRGALGTQNGDPGPSTSKSRSDSAKLAESLKIA
ncbi:hypothetical protein CI109_103295 [Kwoniella shandongensis]|uniref:Uncharacterized protein n=1 Tax=Kwoniella shandongensis TaxID=1734106 RepID=A0A5M6BU92_9TREE|nr:uncharacterized protein CI109_006033 [Kwoniella shandongensis]KAA5525582.1 hypothetical protein CI109_006033 [Kwoniella shandongensis]